MSSIRYNIKTANKPIPDVIHIYLGIREQVDEVNKTVIDNTPVDLRIILEIGDTTIDDDVMIQQRLRQIRAKEKYTLRIESNRFLFSWMAQCFQDIGGMQERYPIVAITKNGTVYDALVKKQMNSLKTPSYENQIVRHLNRGFNVILDRLCA